MRRTPTTDWFEYASTGGRELGLSLHEYETSLRIDLKSNLAFLEEHQPTSDKGGEPLGTSRAIVPADLANQLRDLLDGIDLASVPRSQRSGRSAIRLKRTTDGTSREAVFSNRDHDALRGLGPLMQTLDDILAFVVESPYQAIRLALEHTPGPAVAAFTVKIRNVGREVVCLPDLAELARKSVDDPDHWFGVRIAEYPEPTPGYTPPPFHWVRVELVVPALPPKRVHLLEPGAELGFRTGIARWVTPGIRHLVQAVFSSYAGDAVINRHVVIRGRALSKALRWITP